MLANPRAAEVHLSGRTGAAGPGTENTWEGTTTSFESDLQQVWSLPQKILKIGSPGT